MKFCPPLFLLCVLSLQACGGGGSGGDDATAETPVATAPAPPVVTAPETAVPAVPAVPAVTPPADSRLIAMTGATSCSIPGLREAILASINRARTSERSCGAQRLPATAPLAWNDVLFSAAARHSLDMATRNYFSHTSPEGGDFAQRATAEGYGWSALAENIAAGQASVDGVMATWMGSEGHCRNIMGAGYGDVAVACVARPGTTWGTYWTMALGRR